MKDDIIITLGSPYGIGYEIFLKIVEQNVFNSRINNKTLICTGSLSVLDYFIKHLNISVNFNVVNFWNIGKNSLKEYLTTNDNTQFILIDIDKEYTKINEIKNITSKFDGEKALHAIQVAAILTKDGFFNAVVTLPVSKKNINIIEPSFLGHTEYLQQKWEQKEVFMTFVSSKFTVVLVTTHIPLDKVSSSITKTLYNRALTIALKLKKELDIDKNICALGLNPHAGENGLIGKKEILMNTLIKQFNKENNCNIIGTIPADTAFTPLNLDKFGLYIANYHDQGLIPFKIFSFHEGVNLSYGMDYIRTSVDHGTGVDLIGKNPDTTSFLQAYKIAKKIIKNKVKK